MAPTPRSSRVRPTPLMSPRRRERPQPKDSDDEAHYVVTVRSAKNLKREGFRGLTNPYCQVRVGRQGPFTTDVIFDSINPCWKDKHQTFEFRQAKGPDEDKLSLACFNSGDVPELIGRLNVALSRSHKVISLPMFRKELGGSQVWSGSVEIELDYIPALDASPTSPGSTRGHQTPGTSPSTAADACCTHAPAPGPSPMPFSLASSFAKTALSYPDKTPTSSSSGTPTAVTTSTTLGAADTDSFLQALSPGAAKAKSASVGAVWTRPRGEDKGVVPRSKSDGGDGVEKKVVANQRAQGGEEAGGGWSWRAFGAGVVLSVMLGVLSVSLVVIGGGDVVFFPPAQERSAHVRVLEERGGRQTFLIIDELESSWLANRHAVVLVGDYELCRGGVPAPSPPTEDAQRVYDACVAAAETDSTVAGEKGQIGSLPQGNCEHVFDSSAGRRAATTLCGGWCSIGSFFRRLAEPLYLARRTRLP